MAEERTVIAVDAMGGDHGPEVVVPGALDGARMGGLSLILVGDAPRIQAVLDALDTSGVDYEVVHASQTVTMSDKPTDVVRRKKDSSIHVACTLVKEGRAHGVVSAGNTGATLACGLFILGRIKGVDRPALASIMPTEKKPIVLTDVGANVDSKPGYLLQFGIMASVLAKTVLGYDAPRVGLLSIGEEEGKGNAATRVAYDLFRASSLNFKGNVEGREIYQGEVDVVVCDGFVGNSILKVSEGLAVSLGRILKRELLSGPVSRLGTMLARNALGRFKKTVDYAEYGGAPIMGLQRIAIVCHGSSTPKAIKNAVNMAGIFAGTRANDRLMEALSANEELSRSSRAASQEAPDASAGTSAETAADAPGETAAS
jgi:glycerol-3-phosphate acyltransferase PlsX